MEDDIKSVTADLNSAAEKLLNRKSNRNPLPVKDKIRLIHELEVLQIELEMQHDEFEEEQDGLKPQQGIPDDPTGGYPGYYDLNPLAYFTLNKEGEIMDLNQNAARLFGKERTQLLNSRFGFFVTDDTKPTFNTFLDKVFSSRLKSTCEVTVVAKENATYLQLTGIHSGTNDVCFISSVDNTEGKLNEIYQEMKREILQILNEPGKTKEIIHRILTVLKKRMGFDAIGIRLKEGDDYPYFDQTGFTCNFLKTENTLLNLDMNGIAFRDKKGNVNLACNCGRVLSGKIDADQPFNTNFGSWWANQLVPVISIDSHANEKFHPRNQCSQHGYASVALVPIWDNTTIIGLLQFNDRHKDCFNRNLIAMLEGISSHIGAALMRKHAEETLRKNEELLRMITDNAPDIIIQLDRQGTILYMNRTLPGYTMEECVGTNFKDRTLTQYHEEMNRSLELVFNESITQAYQSQIKLTDGEVRWYRSRISPVREGEVVKNAIMITRDVTEILLNEEILRESEDKRNAIMVTAMDGFWITDMEGRIMEVNDLYCSLCGFTRWELLNMHIEEVEIIDNPDVVYARIQKIRELGEYRYETQHRRKDGSVMEVELNVHFRPIDGGQFVSFIHDITERKQTEKRLRESDERYKSLFRDNHSVMLLINPDTGEIIDANQVACNYYGWSYSELTQKSIFDIDPCPKEETQVKLQDSKKESNNHLFIQHRLANGELRDVEVYSGPIRFGDSTMLYTIIHDITDSKKAQEALRINEERYTLIYNSSRDGIFSIDNSGIFTNVNRSFCKELNLDHNQIVGNDIVELGFPDFLNKELKRLQKQVLESNNSVITELEVPFFDGSLRYYEMVLNPLHDDFGAIIGIGGSGRNVTKRKEASQALKESETRFKSLLKDMPVGVLLYSPSLEVVMSNPKALELLDVPDEKTLSLNTPVSFQWNAIHEDGSVFHDSDLPIKQVVEQLSSVHDLVIGIKRNDSPDITWLLIDAEVLLNEDGALRNVVCSFIDITKLKSAEKELRENEQRLKYHFENSPLAVVEWDNDLKITEWSLEAEHIFGWRKEETIGKNIDTLNLIYNEDIPFIYHVVDRLTSGKEDTVVSYNRNLTKSGTIIDCTWYHSILHDQQGKMTSVMSLVQDITSRKKAEDNLKKLNEELEDRVHERTVELMKLNEGLKQTEEKYRTFSDFATNWEFWIDPVDHMIYCSPYCERITGYSSTEFEENSELYFSIIHPDDARIYQEHKSKEMQVNGCEHELQYRIVKKDGTIRWIGHYCRPVFDDTGDFRGVRGSNKDITARKKMEELLMTSNKKYQLLSENITDGIFICKKGRFEYVNKATYDIFGYKGRELEKMKLTQLVVSDYNEKLEKILYSTEKTNRSCSIEVECLKKDFTIVFVEIILNYVANDKTVYGVIHDITEKKEFQKNMVKAIIQTEEKERAHFSKELHDGLGPLLSTIKLYLQCSERLTNTKSRKQIIGKAGEIIEEALSTVKEISYKLSPHLLTNYGLSSAIKNFVDKLNDTVSTNIYFESNFVRRIDVEIETAFYRAVIECINNTLKYAEASQIYIHLIDYGGQIQLQYKDNGIGFDIDEILSEHRGLGLFNLQNRVHTFGGKVELLSEPGKGVDYLFTMNV